MIHRVEKRRRTPRVLPLAAALLFALPLAAQDEPPAGAPSARDDLRRAAELVEAVKGLRGEPRVEALERAAAAYREVVDRHPADNKVCARAWFEIGDIERRKADLEAAEAAYGKAGELDPERYGVRALLEQAHLQRRQKRWDEALAAYRAIAERAPESTHGHTARVWVGRCLEGMDDRKGAIAAYEDGLAKTQAPARVIELCNWLAKALVGEGDLDGAARAIQRAEAAVAAADGEANVERLRKAVQEMSARKALERARDKASGAHEDAQKLESERRSGARTGGYFVPTP